MIGTVFTEWANSAGDSVSPRTYIRPFMTACMHSLEIIHPYHVLVALLATALAVFVFIKLRYPFWNLQPVLHTYDLARAASRLTCGLTFGLTFGHPHIASIFPTRTKYLDSRGRVQSAPFADLSPGQITEIVRLLQAHYLPSDRLFCSIDERAFGAHFRGYPVVSMLREYVYDSVPQHVEPSASAIGSHTIQTHRHNIIGVVASRGVRVAITGGTSQAYDAHYFDFLCLMREKTCAQDARTLFQTHEWNQRHAALGTHVSVFRKETELLSGVVPLVAFSCATYYMHNMRIGPLPPNFRTVCVRTEEHMHFVHDFINLLESGSGTGSGTGSGLFGAAIYIPVPAIMALVSARQLFVCALTSGRHLYALYFLRNANVKYDELEETGPDALHLVASYSNVADADLFYAGFQHGMREILRDRASTLGADGKRRHAQTERFGILMIDRVGHNDAIAQKWEESHSSMVRTNCAYYLYNYIVPQSPMHTRDCFILV